MVSNWPRSAWGSTETVRLVGVAFDGSTTLKGRSASAAAAFATGVPATTTIRQSTYARSSPGVRRKNESPYGRDSEDCGSEADA